MTMLKKGFLSLAAIAVMTGFVACDDGGEIVNSIIDPVDTTDTTDTIPVGASGSVALDNFEINKFGDAGVGEENYTAQSYLGYQLGGFVDESNDSLQWGGGYWYVYAGAQEPSGSWPTIDAGAKVTTADGTTIVENDGKATNEQVATMLGDDSLSFAIDFTDERLEEKSYYGGVGTSLVGDIKHIEKTDGTRGKEGAKVVTSKPEWSDAEEIITWNLTNLKSITMSGKVQGPAKVSIKGDAEGATKSVTTTFADLGVEISNEELVDFDVNIDVTSLTGWDDIKEHISGLEFEVVTTGDNSSNYLLMKIAQINLNFENEEKKFEAFPFLNITE